MRITAGSSFFWLVVPPLQPRVVVSYPVRGTWFPSHWSLEKNQVVSRILGHNWWLAVPRVQDLDTYWSHASDIGPVNWCSLFINRCLTFSTTSIVVRGREIGWGPADQSISVLGYSQKSLFSQKQWLSLTLLTTSKMLPCMGTVRRKRTSDIRELVWEAYLPCGSDFPYRVYINSNCCDSRIWVIACLVAIIK
jgi:hypothetical protein